MRIFIVCVLLSCLCVAEVSKERRLQRNNETSLTVTGYNTIAALKPRACGFFFFFLFSFFVVNYPRLLLCQHVEGNYMRSESKHSSGWIFLSLDYPFIQIYIIYLIYLFWEWNKKQINDKNSQLMLLLFRWNKIRIDKKKLFVKNYKMRMLIY